MRALNIGPGDEVITTSMTAFASILAILRTGATPVLADIDPETALISLESVKRCFSKKTKAVLLVHIYGRICDMNIWQKFCKSNEIFLIEDCAQSHLASWGGRRAGSFGSFGAYSFYPTKNLGAVGDAGMLITDDQAIAEKASMIRNYGQSDRYHHPLFGMNSRLDEIQAAILSERLKWLSEFTKKRQDIAGLYNKSICNKNIMQLDSNHGFEEHVYHLYVVRSKSRDALQAHLSNAGIQTLIHYPVPVHLQNSCHDVRRDPLGLRFSELHASECLSLPCHPQMPQKDFEKVIQAVNDYGGP